MRFPSEETEVGNTRTLLSSRICGSPPPSAHVRTHLVTQFGQPKLRVITVSQPVVSTVVSDRTKTVRIQGVGPTRVIVIHTGGKEVVAYLPVDQVPALTAAA